ncbi:hypothetical protein G3142_005481 [Salmonella enterica subsp. enterica serovar Montevideo]|nr:hypothetical protein [Salmonella enterica subsp. enterica serovar Montevideo]EEK7814368.1 hypothetical protein [Salmonella enterica subsp. enterica serovar Montevideo]
MKMDPNIKFLETQILFFITRNQPVTRSEICAALEIDIETYFAATLFLRSSKKIIHNRRYGVFAGEAACREWLKKHRKENSPTFGISGKTKQGGCKASIRIEFSQR